MMSSDEAPNAGAAPESPSPTPPASAPPAEESASAATPPDGETPTKENPPTASAPETPADAETPRRRVRLNPTVGQETAKPVALFAPPTTPQPATPTEPSGATESAEPETTTPEATAEETPAPIEAVSSDDIPAPPPGTPSAPKGSTPPPVEIPRGSDSLDSEMEAEIAAALASGEVGISADVPTPTVPTEAGDEEPATEDTLEKGTKLTGKVQSIHGDDVFLDVGFRSPGVVPMRQFSAGKKPEVGQMIEIIVERVDAEEGLILLNLPRGVRQSAGNWDSVAVGQHIDCMVTGTNKGGLEVAISSLRGFMPASQVDRGFVADMEAYVGKKLRVEITEVNPKKRRLIVSRRTIVEAERKELEAELWKKLAAGQTHNGTVKTLKDYGAFIDIGGTDGFLHIGEISHTRIRHPSDVLSEGQEVEVQILKLEPESRKISLGMKQLIADPWKSVTLNYPKESTVSGKVTRVADFGAFVELEPGVEGLVHISEIDHKRVGRVADVLRTGQEVQAQVQEVDPDRKRISLSLKALKEKPEDPRSGRKEEAPVEPYKRQRTGPLKGGNSSANTTSGGLFGNPDDFGN